VAKTLVTGQGAVDDLPDEDRCHPCHAPDVLAGPRRPGQSPGRRTQTSSARTLQLAHPGVVGLFHPLDGKISLAFLTRFPTPRHARWLSENRLAT
jgi:hypothetical protein